MNRGGQRFWSDFRKKQGSFSVLKWLWHTFFLADMKPKLRLMSAISDNVDCSLCILLV